jgi:hypothetical protein
MHHAPCPDRAPYLEGSSQRATVMITLLPNVLFLDRLHAVHTV